MEFSKKICGKI